MSLDKRIRKGVLKKTYSEGASLRGTPLADAGSVTADIYAIRKVGGILKPIIHRARSFLPANFLLRMLTGAKMDSKKNEGTQTLAKFF